MKIRRNTPDLLIVEDTPWLFDLLITGFTLVFCAIGIGLLFSGLWMGLIFLFIGGGIGVASFWAFVRRVQLVFHRPGAWAEIRRANVFGKKTTRYELPRILRAFVQTSTGKDMRMHRVALLIETGGGVHETLPLTMAYTNTGDPHGVASTINDWLGARASDTARDIG